jgi:cyanophycin synthetase
MDDINRLNITARLLAEEAIREGYVVEIVKNRTQGSGHIMRCTKGGQEFYMRSLFSDLMPAYAFFASNDKSLSQLLLENKGVPVPKSVVIADTEDNSMAITLMKECGSVVVKPINLNHGDGITVDVASEDTLNQAIDFARAQSNRNKDVIIQQMVSGEEYRFLVLRGEVLAVAARRPPHVTGDGRSTIKEMIEVLNSDPARSEGHSGVLTKIDIADVHEHNDDGFLGRVPAAGEVVNVLKVSNLSRGGFAIDCTDTASPALKRIAVEAAKSCFLEIAGVDIITNDISSESTEGSYVIEVNNCPGIRMHTHPSQGEPRNVAYPLFKALEETARPIECANDERGGL